MERIQGTGAPLMRFVRRNRRPLRDALILIGLGRAAFYYLVQGIHPWTFVGIDARAYWGVDLAHPYVSSGVGDYSTYLYSPAFAQFLSPLYVLPFEVFFVLWTVASIAVLYWLVKPWPAALLILFLPWTYELFVGQVHLFIAAAIVLGFRWPSLWAFNILTKVTPGVGLLWFLVRRDWRPLAIALGTTAAIVVVSFLLAPTAWIDWYAFLRGSTGSGELLYPRIALASVIVVIGALTDRRWTIPIAVWLALPVVWIESWVILFAIIRLRERPTPVPDPTPAAVPVNAPA
ncbi:MAG TPA: glycosyltransferase family 87 protein [Methylomirabilota bacterium]|nr:glycosyltransferase family 87 protein [Methylomirabilota bacterium]